MRPLPHVHADVPCGVGARRRIMRNVRRSKVLEFEEMTSQLSLTRKDLTSLHTRISGAGLQRVHGARINCGDKKA